MRKNVVLAIAAAIIIGGLTGLWIVHTNHTAAKPTVTATATPAICSTSTTNYVCYVGVDGKDAYTLLKQNFQVQAKDTSYGPMVTSINGTTPDSQHYWAFYVNGTYASVGADKYTTKNGDKIEWKVEAVQQ